MKLEPHSCMTILRTSYRPATDGGALTTVLATVLAVMTVLPYGQAQDVEEVLEIEYPQSIGRSALRYIAQGGFIYQGKADIDGPGGGSMQVNRFDAGIGTQTQLSDRLRWNNTLFFGINDYDFSGDGFSQGNPWETILDSRFGTQLVYPMNEQWGIRGGGLVMLSREFDADWGDSLTGGGTFGVDYRHSESLFVGVGFGVVSQIEDDVTAIPMVAVQWLSADQWAVRLGAVPVGGGALAGAEVAYQLAEQWEVGFGLSYRRIRFRLDDSGPAPNGVGEDQFLPLRMRVAWGFHPQITLHFIAGMAVGGRLKLEDEKGNHLRKEDYDPAAYLGMRAVGRF
jgi:hypothetical protein